jgi:lipoprotein-anchoring transpeptidase ErfK/SrfK
MFGVLLLGSATVAHADIDVRIALGSQTATVTVDGATLGNWPVSTAREGYVTPTGSFRPYMQQRMHYSRRFDNAPMPYSTFFYYGFAIHGTGDVRHLGQPVSHGCVRLSPAHAKMLYDLIRSRGMQHTSIEISY